MLRRVKSCFSHALIFAAQVCAIYVVILLSGLLVFWSAIFIDSKGRKFSRQEDSRILRKHHREIGKTMAINHQGKEGFGGWTAPLPLLDEER